MTDQNTRSNTAAAGTFDLGGDLDVIRMGFGAMRITGEGIWGEPRDRDEALRVLRRVEYDFAAYVDDVRSVLSSPLGDNVETLVRRIEQAAFVD